MKRISFPKILVTSLLLLGVISAGTALAAANNIPQTHIGAYTGPTIGPNDLKPPECDSIILVGIIVNSGTFNSPNQSSNLILGSSGNDTISTSNSGSPGSYANCILGGAGDDTINGGKQNEIILGGPGDDIIDGGKHPGDHDICYGGPGNDTFTNCEEWYQ